MVCFKIDTQDVCSISNLTNRLERKWFKIKFFATIHHLQKSKITSFTFKLSIPIVHDYDHAILVSHNWGVYVSLASLFLFHGVGGIQNHLKKTFNNFIFSTFRIAPKSLRMQQYMQQLKPLSDRYWKQNLRDIKVVDFQQVSS